MPEFDRIDLMLKEVGPASTEIEGIVRNGNVGWEIYFKRDIELIVGFDVDQQKLLIAAEVGLPNPKSRPRVYTALLQFNSMREQTSGVTMAIDGEGTVQQFFEINIGVIETPTLRAVIENFAEKVLAWRVAIQESSSVGNSATNEEIAMTPGIRV